MNNNILALSGGVGGAKLCLGLDRINSQSSLTIIANTGDDFKHLGLYISPDIDTLIYTLSGINNPTTGWGRDDETWNTHSMLEKFGIENWFQLGDKDLALHLYKNEQMTLGLSLTKITQTIAQEFGLRSRILPMTDEPVQTMIDSDMGLLSFQEYFVKNQSKPTIKNISFSGSREAKASPELQQAIKETDFDAIVICPSNPYLSIDPILSIDEIKTFIQSSTQPVIAVSPIVKGAAIKGPTTKIMEEFNIPASVISIAEHYHSLIDGLVIDNKDDTQAMQIESMGLQVKVTNTIMKNDQDKIQLAQDVVAFAETINTKGGS